MLSWLKTRVSAKLLLATTSLMLIVLLALGISLFKLLETFYLNEKANNLLTHGKEIAALLTSDHRSQIAGQVETIGKFVNADVMVVDKTGLVMACGNRMGMNEGMHLQTAEVRQVLAGQPVIRKGFHEHFKEPVLTVAIPVETGNEVIGAVLLYSPYKDFYATITSIKHLILYTALGATALTMLLAFLFSNKLSRPLIAMQKAALQMSTGNFQVRVPIESEDEIGSLAQSINYMAENLDNHTRELSQQKERLSTILTSMSDAVVVFDNSQKVTLYNPPADKLLGQQLAPDKKFGEIFTTLDPRVWQQVLAGQTLRDVEFRLDGKTLSANLSPWKGQDEHTSGVIIIVQDITQKKRTEQIRKEFVASVSHELRTPLSFIQGYSEALLDDIPQSEEEEKEYLGIIKEESIRLRSLVDDLVDLNQLELGQLQLNKSEIDLSDLIKQVVRKYQSTSASSNVALTFTEKGVSQYVSADAMRIQQVLINLLDNAFRHTPAGGTIRIILNYEPEWAVIKVADTGVGIPKEEIPLIWERFYKVDKARTRQGGTGLGLAIVKQIIEGHKGEISVESELNKGTKFIIKLPYKD